MKRKFWSIILVLILLVTAAAPAGTLTAAASDAVEEALSLPDNVISENEELTDAADNGEIIDSEDSADAADNGEIINPEDSADAAEETEPDADEADEVISEEIISPDEAGEQKIEAGEQEDDPAKTGPEDIWEAIFALEKEREVYTPEEHEALFPEIEQIILSSPSYKEGTMEYRDDTLFWRVEFSS